MGSMFWILTLGFPTSGWKLESRAVSHTHAYYLEITTPHED